MTDVERAERLLEFRHARTLPVTLSSRLERRLREHLEAVNEEMARAGWEPFALDEESLDTAATACIERGLDSYDAATQAVQASETEDVAVGMAVARDLRRAAADDDRARREKAEAEAARLREALTALADRERVRDVKPAQWADWAFDLASRAVAPDAEEGALPDHVAAAVVNGSVLCRTCAPTPLREGDTTLGWPYVEGAWPTGCERCGVLLSEQARP